MTYIHEHSGWPGLVWDNEAITSLLGEVRHKQGKHLGKMESLGFNVRAEAGLVTLTNEIVKSSAIEGLDLNPEDVRSSIGRRLGLDVAGVSGTTRDVDGIVEIMLDATQHYDQPLTKERLFSWHAALFPTGRSGMRRITVGRWRTEQTGPMQVVSGPIGREKVHFQAPAANRLDNEMRKFLAWFNSKPGIDLVIKAGVAHLWFVTIHPFEDGNGRIARVIADMMLAQADASKDRFYSMSSGIDASKKEYYLQLESAQRGGLDITNWLVWFLECLNYTLDASGEMLRSVLHKARLWQRINPDPVNERQRKVINRLLDHFQGNLTTSKYAKLAKCSHDTALRDIHELLDWGILLKNVGGGRSTSYRLADP